MIVSFTHGAIVARSIASHEIPSAAARSHALSIVCTCQIRQLPYKASGPAISEHESHAVLLSFQRYIIKSVGPSDLRAPGDDRYVCALGDDVSLTKRQLIVAERHLPS